MDAPIRSKSDEAEQPAEVVRVCDVELRPVLDLPLLDPGETKRSDLQINKNDGQILDKIHCGLGHPSNE